MKKLMILVAAMMAGVVLAEDNPLRNQPEGDRPGPHRRQQMRPGMGGAMAGEAPEGAIMRFVMRPEIAEKIGLTAEQKTKLAELGKPDRELQKKAQEGMKRQLELMKADSIDEAAVMAAIDEVFAARKEIAKAQTKRLIAVRQILTAEQIEAVRAEMKNGFGAPRDRDRPAPERRQRRRGPGEARAEG